MNVRKSVLMLLLVGSAACLSQAWADSTSKVGPGTVWICGPSTGGFKLCQHASTDWSRQIEGQPLRLVLQNGNVARSYTISSCSFKHEGVEFLIKYSGDQASGFPPVHLAANASVVLVELWDWPKFSSIPAPVCSSTY